MKAVVVNEFGAPMRIEDRPTPTPGAGELVVHLEASGLCGLAPGHRSGDAKADRVTERLELQQDDVGRVVFGPQAEQIVAADVGSLPIGTNDEIPACRRWASAAMAIPTPPDCEAIAIPPARTPGA